MSNSNEMKILEKIPVPTFVLSAQGKLLHMNELASVVTGQNSASSAGKKCWNLLGTAVNLRSLFLEGGGSVAVTLSGAGFDLSGVPLTFQDDEPTEMLFTLVPKHAGAQVDPG